jgi:hypothetical protein
MAGITNVGGITSLTDQVIDRLKYWDGSSRTPVNIGLGHSYQQLKRSFKAFVLLKNDKGKPIHRDLQNLTTTADLKFQIIGSALHTMTYQAPACNQDVNDVLDLSYMQLKTLFCSTRSKSMCTQYKPLTARNVLSLIKIPMEALQVLTLGSLNAILIDWLILVALITTRSLQFLLSLLMELLWDLNVGMSFL